jgi:chromosome segregation ATPase
MANDSNLHDMEDFASRSATALRDLEERARVALANNRDQVVRLEAEITAQLESLAATLASVRAAESQNAAEVGQLQAQLDRVNTEHTAAREEWRAEQQNLESHRDELLRQATKLETEQRKARDEWAKQLADFEHKLREQQADWNAQRTEWTATRAILESERDGLQQKFTLALEDVNRYRGRVVELEQELARRPEATEVDSAELVALRAERDALAERIESLERQSATHIDPNAEQQLSDLQRRFELAVEDVRELKTKNAKLEAQLAAGATKSAASPTDSGGMDWESQKRRLLASLEDEGDAEDEPERQAERLKISSTIEMTDAIVADKDAEIAKLRSQVAGLHGPPESGNALQQQKVAELLDADEVIVEHRQRIAQLERDMEATLRAAELELSLERAKIARERVELDEVRAELDSLRNELCPNGIPAPGAPRRRWLSKLGLSGEES